MLTWGVIYSSSGSELWFLQARAPNIYDIPCLHSRNLGMCKDQRAFRFLWNSNKTVTFFVEFQLLMKRLDSEWRFPPVWMSVTNWLPPRNLLRLKHFREIWESQQNWPFGRPEITLNKTCNDWASVENWGQIGSFKPKAAKYAHIRRAQPHMEKSCFLTLQVSAGAQAVRYCVRNILPSGPKSVNLQKDRHVLSNALLDV